MLHYLGDGVNPASGPDTFKPGHFLHNVGTKLDLPAGKACIAHRGSAFMSLVNYSARCPRDGRGRDAGAVLINPSRSEHLFELAKLFPGRRFHRLKGAVTPAFNDGSPTGSQVVLGERDAIFLVRD